jgi:hypothetical protein
VATGFTVHVYRDWWTLPFTQVLLGQATSTKTVVLRIFQHNLYNFLVPSHKQYGV